MHFEAQGMLLDPVALRHSKITVVQENHTRMGHQKLILHRDCSLVQLKKNFG
jgi:hypothetical protein